MSSAEATDISEATTAEATLQQLRLHYTTEANVEASVHVQLDMTAEAAGHNKVNTVKIEETTESIKYFSKLEERAEAFG